MLTRRNFLRTGAGGGLMLAVGHTGSAAPAAGKRPNFVWLLSEDNSKHFLKLFDDEGAALPSVEAMAKDGVVFTHAFCTAPVCSAARSMLITGCYGSRIFTHFHRAHTRVPTPEGLRMFPAYLRKAGYYTSNKRKKDYNCFEGPGVWNSAKDWRSRKAGQPFFHMQTFGDTHESRLHSKPALRLAEGADTVAIPPFSPDTVIARNTYRKYHKLHTVTLERRLKSVLDALAADGVLADTFVFYFGDNGGVLPRSKGYAYETGLHVPLVVRIPENFQHLVDVKRGSRVDGFVSFIDFGPTLLNLAGIKVPEAMDGRPFLGPGVPLAELNKRDEAFGMADRFDEKYDFVRTLRKGRYKYMRSYQPFNFDALQNNYRYKMAAYTEWRNLYRAGKCNAAQSAFFEARPPEALYDLQTDPYEVNNLAGRPEHADTLAALRQRLRAEVKALPDLSFYPESHLVAHAAEDPVAFGQSHKADIARLVDIADLELVPFGEAKAGIAAALAAADPPQRYWGLIVCSTHGKAAGEFIEEAKALAAKDPDPLIRVRAAEFLGLIGAADPRAVLMDVLATTGDPLVALLCLNTIVLLRDGERGYVFTITKKDIKAKHQYIDWRLKYLTARDAES